MSRRKFHRLNPEMIMELKEEGIYRPNFPCNNSDYTPNKKKVWNLIFYKYLYFQNKYSNDAN